MGSKFDRSKFMEGRHDKEAAVEKRENAEMWRGIFLGGVLAGVVASLVWLALSPHKWWFPVPGIIAGTIFMSLEKASTDQVKKEDYPDSAEKYWERVHSALVHFQVVSTVISFAVLVFIFLALGRS